MAGYYTAVFLWASFVLWLIMNVLMVVVPRYGAYTMTLTGLTMLFSTGIYYWLLPDRQLRIHIEDVQVIRCKTMVQISLQQKQMLLSSPSSSAGASGSSSSPDPSASWSASPSPLSTSSTRTSGPP